MWAPCVQTVPLLLDTLSGFTTLIKKRALHIIISTHSALPRHALARKIFPSVNSFKASD